jgi:PPOX class probable F420-dependent enzyme
MPLAPEAVERILDAWPIARLATLDPGGAPHQVPIVFTRVGGRIYSPVDGKPKRAAELVRLANVRRDPRVSLLLDHWEDDWTHLWWLRIDGRARVIGAGDADLGGIERALRAKYPQYSRVPVFRGTPTLLDIDCVRQVSWSSAAG